METYKSSESGKKLLYIFSNLEEIYNSNPKEINIILDQFAIEKDTYDRIADRCLWIGRLIKAIKSSYNTNINNENEANELLNNLLFSVYNENDKKFEKVVDDKKHPYSFGVDSIGSLSEALFIINKDYFFPYYFTRQFYLLKSVFDEFGIFLPPIPEKNDLKKRFFYYWELCKSVKIFCDKYNMTNVEFSAFLYGFAINVISKYQISDVLPEPQKAYFVGGGKKGEGVDVSGDFRYLDEATDSSINNWQGNPDTQPGDIIVMYCLAPRSYIHSIWRAITPGTIDPFFYFYRNVYIGKPVKVSPITIQEIKSDEILSFNPLVRQNMQSINGRQIGVKDYDRILEILKQKGDDIEKLPHLKEKPMEELKLKNERDVEIKLLEPLLKRLGFSENDWKRQVKVKIGRSERIIPDYVIFPELITGNEKGKWIWEAKYSIPNHKQLKEDSTQAKSYALRFQSKGFSLVSKEGVWISDKNLDIDNSKYWTWKQLENSDYFSELFDIVGKKKKM